MYDHYIIVNDMATLLAIVKESSGETINFVKISVLRPRTKQSR